MDPKKQIIRIRKILKIKKNNNNNAVNHNIDYLIIAVEIIYQYMKSETILNYKTFFFHIERVQINKL